MLKEYIKKEEKKVQYIELIYDLIFIYILGRNNSLLHHIEGGFIAFPTYLTYLLTTLIILQIWYFTTLFLNRYGTNSVPEYIGLFINMYLMYYMAQGTSSRWQDYYIQYNVALALILINLAVQYFLKLRKCPETQQELRKNIKFNIGLLLSEAAIVVASVPVFTATGLPLSPLAMVAGIIVVLTVGKKTNARTSVDFPHLSERVMLYVVFTFGEMIIGIAGYFSDGFNFNGVYFSLMGFLIVAGLFFIYGYYYDHIVDREKETNGSSYMLLHIFIITAMNNITVALEFMREEEVDLVKKNTFLVISFVLFFGFLTMMMIYAKSYHKPTEKFFVLTAGLTIAFAALMAAFYKNSYVSIAVTVLYIYSMLVMNIILGYDSSRKNAKKLLH